MIYADSRESRRGKPSTCLPRMDHEAKEEKHSTGTLRCRFREKNQRMGSARAEKTGINMKPQNVERRGKPSTWLPRPKLAEERIIEPRNLQFSLILFSKI